MNDLVIEFNLEETLVIDDFVEPSLSVPVMPESAVQADNSGLQASLQAARDAILSGRRLIV